MTILNGLKSNPRHRQVLLLVSLLCLLSTSVSCTFYLNTFSLGGLSSAAEKAERHAAKKEYEQAITLYLKHIQDRLRSPYRSEDENPYFYYLLIADLYLEQEDVSTAIRYLEDALEKDVNPQLTTERIRRLGAWHEQRDEFEEAFVILRKHRSLDPMLFDLEIDRIHKALVRHEEFIDANKPKDVRFPPR